MGGVVYIGDLLYQMLSFGPVCGVPGMVFIDYSICAELPR